MEKNFYNQVVDTLKELGEYISMDFVIQQKVKEDKSLIAYLYSAKGEISNDSSFEFDTTLTYRNNICYTSLEMFSWYKGEVANELLANTLSQDTETVYVFNLYDAPYGEYQEIKQIKTLEDLKNYLLKELAIDEDTVKYVIEMGQ